MASLKRIRRLPRVLFPARATEPRAWSDWEWEGPALRPPRRPWRPTYSERGDK